jgi:hypothetical protein
MEDRMPMADIDTTTRGSLADKWTEATRLRGEIDCPHRHFLTEDAADAAMDRLGCSERAVLLGTPQTAGDVVAQLKAVAQSFEAGVRGDEAERVALAAAITWLEAH